MQWLSKYNDGVRFLLCVIDIYNKYAWFVPFKDKKGITNTYASQKVLDNSGRKPKKIWVDWGSEFYKISMKSCLHDNALEMYLIYNKGKSVCYC